MDGEKQLQWKNVKKTFICSLHFESNCFRGRKLDFKGHERKVKGSAKIFLFIFKSRRQFIQKHGQPLL